MDPKRPKNEISQIRMKPTPPRSVCGSNSDRIVFFKNGLCMAKISHYEFFPKHAKSLSQQSLLLMSAVCQHDM